MTTSFLKPTEAQTNAIKCIGARLLNEDVLFIEPIAGGRNSQVYRLVVSDSRSYALKAYFRHTSDSRDRLETEFSGLGFLWESGVRKIPKPIASDREQGCAVYEYVDGQRLSHEDITELEIDAAVLFLTSLKELNLRARSRNLGEASEACFSGQAIIENLQWRLDRLLAQQENGSGDRALRAFLLDELVPVYGRIIQWSRSFFGQSGMSFEQDLDFAERTLSPSDFGFHNAVRRRNGEIVFLDFEYFGWDDPAKMVADFLLHPAMELSEGLKREFTAGMLHQFTDYPRLDLRIQSVYPLFGLKWCFILLNEFFPDHFSRRQFAGMADCDRHNVQKEQLLKARRILRRINAEYEHFPYVK